jgi:uncharacterized membrane protein YphA (DoxX/SURF4 family)
MRGINLVRGAAVALSHPYLHMALRLFLGGMFILSAASKLPDHTEFEEVVKNYDLLPDFMAVAYANALPWIELLVGVYLLLGILIRPSAVVTMLMGISFIVANVSSIVRGEEVCGSCFGELASLPAWEALTIDVLILIAAAILFWAGVRAQTLGLDSIFERRRYGSRRSSLALDEE